MSKWNINVPAALGVVKDAGVDFDPVDGIEKTIQTAGSACCDAAVDERIFTAMNQCYDNALRPLSVTMVKSARSIFSKTKSIINTYDNADLDMGTAGKKAETQAIETKVKGMDDVPSYSPGESTETSPSTSLPADPKNPDRNSEGGYRL
jgi:hypothetical protein